MTTKNWFEIRGLRVLNYQQNAIAKVQQSLIDREITVLAAAPSAGKTLMSIYIIEEYLKQNPQAKVLVLTHGTKILRSQYYENLVKYKPDFSFACAESCAEYQEYSKTHSLIVTLPHTLARCKKLIKSALLVVDEAHHFYFATKKNSELGMVEDITKKIGAKKQLLLTGTPSEFILKGFNIIPVSLNTIHDAGMVSDFYVDIASSSYGFDYKDFDGVGDLIAPNKAFHVDETNKTLDNLIKEIVRYINSIRGNDYTNLMPDWMPTLKRLKKTMIACKSRPQARQVHEYFKKIGVKSVVSISEDDVKSAEIDNFVKDKDILVLIVVGRGVLGFNYTQLVNVVDMTMSYNIDRIYQLMCRAARKYKKVDNDNKITNEDDNSQKKLFFKLAPVMLDSYYQHIMTCVCMLTEEEYFLKYNGRNFKDMEVIIKKAYNKRKTINETTNETTVKSKKKQKKYMPIDMDGLPVFEFFKSIYHKKGELLSVYAKTTMNDIYYACKNKPIPISWTKEMCIESAKRYKGAQEWCKNDGSAYNVARNNGWYEECTAHMPKAWQWTKEECVADALKYTNKTDWRNANGTPIAVARRNGWIGECTAHMKNLLKSWCKELCIEDAKKYNTLKEWRNGENSSAYQTATRKGWLEECSAHMLKTYTEWTLEMCKEIALKYKMKSELQLNDSACYSIARKRGWLDECCAHMENNYVKNYWTKERCLESAKKYNTIKDWKKNETSGAEASARRNGWMKECTAHMQTRKPIGYWTKERCLESAKKYDTPREWKKNESTPYSTANNNGWYEECTAHMTNTHVSKNYWNKENCIADAKKYNTIVEWQKGKGNGYDYARRNNWLNECTAHMIRICRKPWTKEECIADALKYKTANEWMSNSSAYTSARVNGWLIECNSHFITTKKPAGYWTKERCIETAKEAGGITSWIKKFAGAYLSAQKNGWLDEIKKLFKKDNENFYFELIA